MSTDDATGRLEAALPAGAVLGDEAARARYALDDVVPALAVRPQTPEQVAAVLHLAAEAGWRVVPWGSGSAQAGVHPPARYDVALLLDGLNAVLDHDADNLTLTVQAGVTVAAANAAVRGHHQMLAVAAEDDPRTLGGVVSTNPAPPRRLLYGDVRDQLLGVRVALPDGTVVRFGRKVLKNVAGYDMNKLFLGAHGLLGVVVEATFKLFALPDERGAVLAAFPTAEAAFACAAELFGSALLPGFVGVLDAAAATTGYGDLHRPVPAGALHLAVGFEGRGVTLRRQVRDVEAMLRRHGAAEVNAHGGGAGLREALACPRPEAGNATDVRLRLGALQTELPAVLARLQSALAAAGLPHAVAIDYGAGLAHVGLRLPEAAAPHDAVAALVTDLRPVLGAQRGYLIVEQAPAALKRQMTPWGELDGELALLDLFRVRFDPHGVLAPERFLAAAAAHPATEAGAATTTPPAAGRAGN